MNISFSIFIADLLMTDYDTDHEGRKRRLFIEEQHSYLRCWVSSGTSLSAQTQPNYLWYGTNMVDMPRLLAALVDMPRPTWSTCLDCSLL